MRRKRRPGGCARSSTVSTAGSGRTSRQRAEVRTKRLARESRERQHSRSLNLRNRNTAMTQATARHILVDSEAKAEELKQAIENGQDFAEVARKHSSCPSGRNGGDLGSFGPGQMVPEFDKAVFNSELNTVIGPIQTQFGYHLLEVTSRS
nr:peptidylprolyl isomerase [Marinobacter daqiaonensis]